MTVYSMWDDSPEACQARRDALPAHTNALKAASRPSKASPRRSYRSDRESTIEDVEFLIDSNETMERVAERVGRPRKSLIDSLRRWGRDDLADKLTVSHRDDVWAESYA